ncbi:MAG: glutamate--tRNA ligase [Dactylosporangium sp.]|nr:glutamate--tRNA ligase [Dactylosporangium sp.]
MTPRVRFAPSPTGLLHIGGARTVLFNHLFARATGGALVLRVEDTDTSRSTRELAEALMDTMEWLGIRFTEGPREGGPHAPYFQSQRAGRHRERAEALLREGRAYRCWCTQEELAERRQAALAAGRPPRYDGRCRDLTPEEEEAFRAEGRRPALRLRVPEEGQTVVDDLVKGRVVFENGELDDFVILRSDGSATYNFAAVVDDADMGITHILRADEHLSNTPKQIHVYRALGEPVPAFGHLPMVLAPDRSKLSKRHGAVSVEEFRERGFLPEAIVNYVALLGWSPGDEREIFTLAELERIFSLDRVSRTAAIYDVQKMEWLNAQHLRRLAPEEILRRAWPWLRKAGLVAGDAPPEDRSADEGLLRAVELVRERIRTLADVPHALDWYLKAPESYDEAGARKHFSAPGARATLERCAELASGIEPWDEAAIESAYREEAERAGLKAAALIHPTRLALTGRTVGPGLFALMALLPRDEVIDRLRRAARHLL